jgi:hypothetical protein
MSVLFEGDENYAVYDNDENRIGFNADLFLTKPKLKFYCLLCKNIIRIPKQWYLSIYPYLISKI